jgi:hypothetical protein
MVFLIITVSAPALFGGTMPFIENRGQCDEAVRFHAPTFGGTVFVTNDGAIVYALPHREKATGWVLMERFAKNAVPVGIEPARAKVSFFKPDLRISAAPTFSVVSLGEIHDGITVELEAHGRNVEKLFRLRPGADPAGIRIALSGAALEISEAGELVAVTGLGEVKFTKPVAWQEAGEEKIPVDVAYWTRGNEYGFTLKDYDRSKALFIDPLLASTYLGGGEEDRGMCMKLAAGGEVYLAGYTASADFPTTTGAYDTTYNGGDFDLFVSRFDSGLTTLEASTFLGGSGDEGYFYSGLLLDGNGDVYVTGNTPSADFPVTPGAYDTTYNGGTSGPYGSGDVFVARFDADLSTLKASTFLGGDGNDYTRSILLDKNGKLCLGGATSSTDFPATAGAYCTAHKAGGQWGMDLYAAVLSADLASLSACTYLGGTGDDFCEGMALDGDGNFFVGGWASSQDYPTTAGAFDTTYNGHYYDAMVSKLSSDLSALSASTYLGGNSWEFIYHLIADGNGTIYVTGHTASTNFPTTTGAYDESYNGIGGANQGDDLFLTRLSNDLTSVMASTYLGGGKWENGSALALDGAGNLYVAGMTSSLNFPVTPGAYDTSFNGGTKHNGDLFISRLDTGLSTLSASTYLGGSLSDGGYFLSLCFRAGVGIYLTGCSLATDYPVTPGCYDPSFNGGDYDAVVSLLDAMLTEDPTLTSDTDQVSAGTGGTVNFTLIPGADHANRAYLVLGSVTGTQPGYPLPGGVCTLPLNWDVYTDIVLSLVNSPLFTGFMGSMDGTGSAAAQLNAPPLPAVAVGVTLYHAFTMNNPFDFVSNPHEVEIVP